MNQTQGLQRPVDFLSADIPQITHLSQLRDERCCPLPSWVWLLMSSAFPIPPLSRHSLAVQ
jgi:hypothetical protein